MGLGDDYALPPRATADLLVVSLLSVMLLGVALFNRRKIIRPEALLLLLVYVIYIGWRASAH